MPIRSLLSEGRFRPEQTEIITKAFEDAWDQLRAEQADPLMESLLRTALAKRIIEIARHSDLDAQALRDDAMAYIRDCYLWPDPRPTGAGQAREINEGDSERQ